MNELKNTEDLSFNDVVRLRRSCRQFLSKPLSPEIIKTLLEDAQQTPSNCNTQPWNVHIASGQKLEDLSNALLEANDQKRFSPDFSFETKEFYGSYRLRQQEQGRIYYETLGITRTDSDARKKVVDRNLDFFGAPHVALLFMPSFGDNVGFVRHNPEFAYHIDNIICIFKITIVILRYNHGAYTI